MNDQDYRRLVRPSIARIAIICEEAMHRERPWSEFVDRVNTMITEESKIIDMHNKL